MKLTQNDSNRLIRLRVSYTLIITQIDDFTTFIFMCDVHVYRYTNPRKWKILTKIDNECNFLTKYIPTWLYLNKPKF